MKPRCAKLPPGTAHSSAFAAAHRCRIRTPSRGLKFPPALWMTIHSFVRIGTFLSNSSPHGSRSPTLCPSWINPHWSVYAAVRCLLDSLHLGRLPLTIDDFLFRPVAA